MQINTHHKYDKMWAKLNQKQQAKAVAVIRLSVVNPENLKLRLRQLKGKYYPEYSISAGGDLRINFTYEPSNIVILMMVGTHSQLYG